MGKIRIRDPGWVKIRIRDKHPGSATLPQTRLDLTWSDPIHNTVANVPSVISVAEPKIKLPPRAAITIAAPTPSYLSNTWRNFKEKILVSEEVFVNCYNFNHIRVKLASIDVKKYCNSSHKVIFKVSHKTIRSRKKSFRLRNNVGYTNGWYAPCSWRVWESPGRPSALSAGSLPQSRCCPGSAASGWAGSGYPRGSKKQLEYYVHLKVFRSTNIRSDLAFLDPDWVPVKVDAKKVFYSFFQQQLFKQKHNFFCSRCDSSLGRTIVGLIFQLSSLLLCNEWRPLSGAVQTSKKRSEGLPNGRQVC